jgi:hypothetical protein
MMATPLEIEIGLYYQTRTNDYRDGDHSAPAVSEALERFVALGLLARGPNATDSRKFRPTEGMRVWVNALRDVPFPENVWVMPHPTSDPVGFTDDQVR